MLPQHLFRCPAVNSLLRQPLQACLGRGRCTAPSLLLLLLPLLLIIRAVGMVLWRLGVPLGMARSCMHGMAWPGWTGRMQFGSRCAALGMPQQAVDLGARQALRQLHGQPQGLTGLLAAAIHPSCTCKCNNFNQQTKHIKVRLIGGSDVWLGDTRHQVWRIAFPVMRLTGLPTGFASTAADAVQT